MTFAKNFKIGDSPLVDVNVFNHYHAFQIEAGDKNTEYTRQSSVQMRFRAPPKSQSDEESFGLIFRLRAELSTADSDLVQQGMRVSLVNEQEGIIVDGSTIDNDEGALYLQYDGIKEDKEYIVRYDLYDREIQTTEEAQGSQYSNGIKCKLPFITQQLMIIDKRLALHRVGEYEKSQEKDKSIDLQREGLRCDLDSLNQSSNSSIFSMLEMEAEVYCLMQNYHFKSSFDQPLVKVYEKRFEVEPLIRYNMTTITYFFDVQFGFNLLATPGIKILLARADYTLNMSNPYQCLAEKSCQMARMIQKNMLRLSLLITSGKYRLIILDQQPSLSTTDFDLQTKSLQMKLADMQKPVSIKIQANNVIQNEERVNCPYMYLDRDFLQNKFIEGMAGQRFTFSDSLVLNIQNQTQSFFITPEATSILKIRSHEAQRGVNIDIILKKDGKLVSQSRQEGMYEVFFFEDLQKGQQYEVEMSFHNSLIQIATEQSCPTYHLEVSMMSKNDFEDLLNDYKALSDAQAYQSESKVTAIFNTLENLPALQPYNFNDPSTIFSFQNPTDSSNILSSKIFHVQHHKQTLYIEIYYSSFLQYDLSLILTSHDVKNIRAHKTKINSVQSSRRIMVELEQGEYEVSIVYSSSTKGKVRHSSVKFQMQMSYAKDIDEQNAMPKSLNYYGMLGPEGKGFGQMVYFCKDCKIEKTQFTFIEFHIDSTNDNVNFDAVISSPLDIFNIRLEKIENKEPQSDPDTLKKGIQVGKRMTRDRRINGGLNTEHEISQVSLQSKTLYRLVLTIKNTIQDTSDDTGYIFTLRIDIQESSRSLVPRKTFIQPPSFTDFTRFTRRVSGERESGYLMLTTQALKFIDSGKLSPFQGNCGKVYQVKSGSSEVIYSVEFEIEEDEGMIYASIVDYSQGANGGESGDQMGQGLGIRIVKKVEGSEDEEEMQIESIPGKYFNYIPSVTLQKGKYDFQVFHSSFTKDAQSSSQLYRFSLNVRLEKEDPKLAYSMQLLETSVQLCTPSPPLPFPKTLTGPAHLFHPLSGGSDLSLTLDLAASDALSSGSFKFTLPESDHSYMLSVYIESPTAKLEVRLHHGYQIAPETAIARGMYDQVNAGNENFIKQNQIKSKNIVQVRAIVEGGQTYTVVTQGIEGSKEIIKTIGRCDKVKLVISLAQADRPKKECAQVGALEKQLKFGQEVYGNVSYSTYKPIFDSTYLTTNTQAGLSAPYLFYFQANFDPQIDGPIGLILYKYDIETLSFSEFQAFSLSDSSSQILARIDDDGTYLIAIVGFQSQKSKYPEGSILVDQCVKLQYNYYINSLEKDWRLSNIASDLIQILPKLNDCDLDSLPASFLDGSDPFDLSYTLSFNQYGGDTILDIPVTEGDRRLFKLMLYSYDNPNANINGYLFKNLSMTDQVASTKASFDEKVMLTILPNQKRPYKLKIVQDTPNQFDVGGCRTYKMRVASQAMNEVVNEKLKCRGKSTVPQIIKVDQEVYGYEMQHEITLKELVSQGTKQDQNGQTLIRDVKIEIQIKTPQKSQEYYFDIELTHDFITMEMEAILFMITKNNERLELGDTSLSRSYQSHPSDRDLSTNTKSVKRLKLDNIRDMVDEELTDNYLLQIQISKMTVSFAKNLKSDNICFPYSLSLRVSKPEYDEVEYEKDTDPSENELVRVQWDGTQPGKNDNQEIFNPANKLVAQIEFKESLKEDFSKLKFETFVYLQSLDDPQEQHYPEELRLLASDKSSLLISFEHSTLKWGKCYRLQLSNHTTFTTRIKHLDMASIVCATKCQSCGSHGTSSCNEETAQCICRPNYTGEKCEQCQTGYIMDEQGMCRTIRQCKSLVSSVEEDCNGHGACYHDEKTGDARCRCEPGFENDGLELCGRCQDTMFTYPNCQQRFWMVSHSKYDCQDLKIAMPIYLYKNQTVKQEKVYQNEEGSLYWYDMYRLDTAPNIHSFKSYHFFELHGDSSMLRIFYDTHFSGVEAKFRILTNPDMQIIFDSKDLKGTYAKVMKLSIPASENKITQQLVIEFEYVMDQNAVNKQQCPLIEILLIMQPSSKIQTALKCTSDQLSQLTSKLSQLPSLLSTSSSLHQQNVTLSSEQALVSQDDQYFYHLKQPINIPASSFVNSLSILATYNFESVYLYLSLVDVKTGNTVAQQTFSYIEDVQGDEQYGNLASKDMLSYIEIKDLPSGQYELVLSVDKALFMGQQSGTCITFDLIVEHIPWKESKTGGGYQIVAILPPNISNIKDKIKIEIKLDRAIKVQEQMPAVPERVCRMEAIEGVRILYPTKVMINGESSFELYFDFKGVQLDKSLSNKETCFQLKCPPDSSSTGSWFTDYVESPKQYIDEIKISSRYCVSPQSQSLLKCNPNSLATVKDNKCVCSTPYTGNDCEQCEPGYLSSLDSQNHTVCSVDLTKCSDLFCSNHGRCFMQNNSPACKCTNSLYTGLRCDKCADPTLAYPLCQYPEIEQNPRKEREIRYNKNGYENLQGNISTLRRDKCFFSNYPKDLDTLSFAEFLPKIGDFHVAEYYTASHDHDNQIKFTPPKQGIFKIFIQQPEDEDLIVNDESYDIEIGIYDKVSKKFLATAVNSKIDMQVGGIDKLDFATLSWEVPVEMVGKEVLIVFRAVNFTNDGKLDEQSDRCLSLYIEIQFKFYQNTEKVISQTSCQLDPDTNTKLPFTSNPIFVSEATPYLLSPLSSSYLLTDSSPSFLSYQDFTFTSTTSADTLFALHLSVFQDFLDPLLLDAVFEILSFDSIQDKNASEILSVDKPTCAKLCVVGAQKAYNEFHNVLEITTGATVRVWLYKVASADSVKGCGKVQIQIEAHAMKKEQMSQVQCLERKIPETLNIPEFIGVEGDQGIHIKEKFRIDMITAPSHPIKFKLKEPMMMRVIGIQHKHIEFDIELSQEMSNGKSRKLIDSGAKGFEDSIFAQLDSGSYFIKLIFVSEAFFMTQPCQSVELQLAFESISNLKKTSLQKYEGQKYVNLKQLLENRTSSSDIFYFSGQNFLKNFNLNNQQEVSAYKSFIEIETATFMLPSSSMNGLSIEINSDFLRNDISFAVTNVKTKRLYANQRNMLGKRLVIEELSPEEEYEFTIYMHQSLSNFDTPLTQQDYAFSIDVQFLTIMDSDDFKEHRLQLTVNNASVTTLTQTLIPQDLECLQSFPYLPSQYPLNHAFFGTFQLGEGSIHVKNDDQLARIIIDEDNLRMVTDKKHKSFSVNRDMQSIIYMQGASKVDIKREIGGRTGACQGVSVSLKYFQDKHCSSQAIANQQTTLELNEEDQISKIVGLRDDKVVTQNLKLAKTTSDLDIKIDFSQLFYVPVIKIFSLEMDQGVDQTEIEPVDVQLTGQSSMIYVYQGLPQQIMVAVYQPKKESECSNNVPLIFTPRKKVDQHSLSTGKIFISHEEIKNLNRYVEPLPVTLDTYKYLKNDKDYLLISEYLNMDEDNRITFSLQKEEDTYFKIVLESSDIYMTLRDQNKNQIVKSTSNLLEATLKKGKYELLFEFSTSHVQSLNQLSLKNMFHLTLLIADRTFLNSQYLQQNAFAFQNCGNLLNFPLALNKQKSNNNIMIYDFELIRVSGSVLQDRTLIDKYAFRVNQTSRFYLSLGAHQVINNAQLRLQELNNDIGGAVYYGKYEFNQNVLDYVIGPGDYQLAIEQPQSGSLRQIMKMTDSYHEASQMCGLFSLTGKISPIENLNGNSQVQQSKCVIKAALPNKIYASETQTKEGGEHYISSEGSYTRFFKDVLVKKSRDQKDPDSDMVQIDLGQSDCLVAVSVQHKKHHQTQIQVSLLNQQNKDAEQIFVMQRIVGEGIIEQTYVYSGFKFNKYELVLTYTGEIESGEECEYFNIQISINSDKHISDSLQCVEGASSLMEGSLIPSSLRVNTQVQGLVQLKYPEDYNKYGKISGHQSSIITKEIAVNGAHRSSNADNLELEAVIAYDFPFSGINLQLIEEVSEGKQQMFEEESAVQKPVKVDKGNEKSNVMVRELDAEIMPQTRYKLVISDTLSWHILNYAYSKSKMLDSLCLAFKVSLSLTDPSSSLNTLVPSILSISPSHLTSLSSPLPPTLQVTLSFTHRPHAATTQGAPSPAFSDLAGLFLLRCYGSSHTLTVTKRPSKISASAGNALTLIYMLTTKEQETLKDIELDINLDKLADSQGRKFSKQSLQLPKWQVSQAEGDSVVPKSNKRMGQMRRRCECKHGTCKKGEEMCNKCDQGWTGRKCDIELVKETTQADRIAQKVQESVPTKRMSQSSSFKELIPDANSDPSDDLNDDSNSSLLYSIFIYILTFGFIVFILNLVLKHRQQLRDYIPISLSEDDPEENHQSTELTELKTISSQENRQSDVEQNSQTSGFPLNPQAFSNANQQVNQQNPQYHQSSVIELNNEFDDQAAQLSKELQLFSEADQNLIYEQYSDHQLAERQNGKDEIDDVLREMEEQFYEEDDEFGKFI